MNPFNNVYQIYLNDYPLPLAADPYWYSPSRDDASWTAAALNHLYRDVNEYARALNNYTGRVGWPSVSNDLRRITYYTRDPSI